MLDLKQAIGLDSFDATLYSNRSLCYLKIGEAQKALLDAETCINNRPDWVKGYYRKGAALMLLKVNDTTVNYCHLFLPCFFLFKPA
jgi:tetratricopeptide (TPR) repeat protein